VAGRATSQMKISLGRNMNSLRTTKTLLLAVVVSTALLATACYNLQTGRVDVGGSINFELAAFPQTGSHAVELYTEMHYQPSYRMQEGPRILPPEGSVPITGAEVYPTSMDEFQTLSVPSKFAANYDDDSAWHTYQVNCLVCHGEALDGKGPITSLIGADGGLAYDRGPFPADLRADPTKNATNGELFGFISGGGRQGLAVRLRGKDSTSPMPEFRKMLSEEERWALVQFLRSRIGE